MKMDTLKSILSIGTPILVALFTILVFVALVRFVLRLYVPVPPNEALIVYGRRGMRTVTAGGTFVWPVVEKTAKLGLQIMTIEVSGDEVKTISGVPILVDWTAQVKVGSEEASIKTAAQVFLGSSEQQIMDKAQLTLGGNLREVISKLTVLQVHTDRDAFIGNVQTIIADEMNSMGLFVVSLTIQDVYDPEGQTYFKDMAAKDIAEVQKTARMVRAEANRIAAEKEAQEERATKEAQALRDIAISEAEKNRDLKKAAFKKEADTAQAEANLAGELARQIAQQAVVTEEQKVEFARTQQQITVAVEQAKLKERQLETEIKKPADAEAYRIGVTATAAREKLETEAAANAEAAKLNAEATKADGAAKAEVVRLNANAEADSTRAKGDAEASATKAKLLAEAEGQRELAAALAAQGEINLRMAAIEKMLNAQVDMVRAMAQPLGAIGANMKVVQITGDSAGGGSTNPVFAALLQAPEVLTKLSAMTEALSGKGITELLEQTLNLVQASKSVPTTLVAEETKKTPARAETPKAVVETAAETPVQSSSEEDQASVVVEEKTQRRRRPGSKSQ